MSLKQSPHSAIIFVALAAGLGLTPIATASITIISASVDAICNGNVGKMGSTTGLITDDPPQIDGNATLLTTDGGLLAISSQTSGGPVAPGDLVTLPGTSALFTSDASASLEVIVGSAGMIITQHALTAGTFDQMDGGLGSVGGNANARIRFSVSVATPYTLSGFAAFDDEDNSGSVRLNTAIGIAIRSVFEPQNGPFTFTGTLNPGTYSFTSNCNILAVMGGGGVGNFGSFEESGTYTATLVLGTPPCDDLDFNNDGLFPDDADLIDFLSVFAGGPCSTGSCNDIDFNNDGLFPDEGDLVAFLTVLAGGSC